MKNLLFLLYALLSLDAAAQDSLRVKVIHEYVGEVIDSTEKSKYHLFPFLSSKQFISAQFLTKPDGSVILRAKMKYDTIMDREFSEQMLEWTNILIEGEGIGEFIMKMNITPTGKVIQRIQAALERMNHKQRSEYESRLSRLKKRSNRSAVLIVIGGVATGVFGGAVMAETSQDDVGLVFIAAGVLIVVAVVSATVGAMIVKLKEHKAWRKLRDEILSIQPNTLPDSPTSQIR